MYSSKTTANKFEGSTELRNYIQAIIYWRKIIVVDKELENLCTNKKQTLNIVYSMLSVYSFLYCNLITNPSTLIGSLKSTQNNSIEFYFQQKALLSFTPFLRFLSYAPVK